MHPVAGLDIDSSYIEPLQLVKYDPSETFMPHHDYHEPGPDGKLGSSVQGEQRAFTCLLFGSTLPADGGGETHFPHLGVAVTPRRGDALIWANVDGDGVPNPRSLHEGRPPLGGEKVAVNVWIADKPFDVGRFTRCLELRFERKLRGHETQTRWGPSPWPLQELSRCDATVHPHPRSTLRLGAGRILLDTCRRRCSHARATTCRRAARS